MTLTLSGNHDLDSVVASVLGRLGVAAGMPDADTSGLVAAVTRAVDDARAGRNASVRVAFAWATDHIDIEIGAPDELPEVRLSHPLPTPLPRTDGPAPTT